MSSNKRLFIQIYEVIVTDILNNRYKYGDSLPSLSELCKSYNAGRNTLRSVMILLEEKGFIKTKRGRKAEVIFNINEANSRKLYETTIYERKAAYEDIYQFLIAFMPEVIIEVKNRASDEKIDDLINNINKMFDRHNVDTSAEEFTKKLYMITIKAIAILDNSLLDSLYLSMIRFIYLPIPSSAKKGKSFFAILNLVSDRLPKIADFLLTRKQMILRSSITILMQTLAHSSLQYVNRIGKSIEGEDIEAIPFRWVSVRSFDLLYMNISIQIIQDINNDVYGEYLPSLQEMVDKYQVSMRTIRKATDLLSDYKIIQKSNGLKSKIIIKQIHNTEQLFNNHEVVVNIIRFKEAIQVLFLLIKSINKSVLPSLTNQEINNLIGVIDQTPKQLFESFIHVTITHSNQTMQSIYDELVKSLAWNIYSEKMFYLSDYNQYLNSHKQTFIKAIKKKNYDVINEYLNDLYTYIEKDVDKIIKKHKE